MEQEKRSSNATEKKDDRSIHHRREGVEQDEAQAPTRGEPLSGADHERKDTPAPASTPRE